MIYLLRFPERCLSILPADKHNVRFLFRAFNLIIGSVSCITYPFHLYCGANSCSVGTLIYSMYFKVISNMLLEMTDYSKCNI